MTAPPPPPPHGSRQGSRTGLPDGSYDIFIVPPHSSGGGFIYFPSLQTNRNSFLAGVGCTLSAVMVYTIVLPVLREWTSALAAGGGFSVILLLLAAGIAGWAWGKTQLEATGHPSGSSGAAPQPEPMGQTGSAPNPGFSSGFPPRPESRPPPTWQRSAPGTAGGTANPGATKGAWEKAREETKKKEEERKKAEEVRKKREEDEKERIRNREKETREREARERREKEAAARNARPPSPTKNHRFPTAKTATDDASSYSYRPYDKPNKSSYKPASASSMYSESSYAPSHSTGKTTPPPSHRGPYQCKDPDKIVIKAVYSFNNAFIKTPIAKLISGMGSVTDGLILRITTEGLFIDDDVRGVPQREWDVKAWTLKLVETGELRGHHVLRASIRDAEGKRYVFILREEEGWKVAVGLQKLRRGTQVRALGVSGMSMNESKAVLENAGFI